MADSDQTTCAAPARGRRKNAVARQDSAPAAEEASATVPAERPTDSSDAVAARTAAGKTAAEKNRGTNKRAAEASIAPATGPACAQTSRTGARKIGIGA